MNVFDIYINKIQSLIYNNSKSLNFETNISMDGVIIETPPPELNFDLSTNIALVLAKKTKQAPIILAESIKKIIHKNLEDFSTIEVAGPGFINFKFTPKVYQKLMLNILEYKNKYG
jgi:arginyl-tRNA synthetase